ncbi:tRNA 5-methoxyuridine(34)/uridine 5-oxyacetic acid(34) synthase CmoB [Methylomonas sp. AM2-LC]|uniref:tRNA 5-methoxyuridine(34)/uridine 5-oxyacetic acid(34) synthase CmoB n=1 Tax=Methylomonas sp. AM2-LC TaxID=3153301 RepID=UPI003266FAE8
MVDYLSLYQTLDTLGAGDWANILSSQVEQAFAEQVHGDLVKWRKVIDDLSQFDTSSRDLFSHVQIGRAADLTFSEQELLNVALKKLHPWRKGPFSLFGIEIDSEWRSDWKWERLKKQIAPLNNRLVLDVGCGNGYHCWRMLGAGAKLVVGIDPTLLSVLQFQMIRKLYGDAAVYVLPIGIDDMPNNLQLFDTVFSMGVLYHRRSPIDHLLELKNCLRSGGELVLETLVIEGGAEHILVPEQRYAQMRNVWFLPSCDALLVWLKRCGFKNIKLVDVTKTSIDEQRSTEWMQFHSLRNFLDHEDQNFTCEGLPAPVRAIFIAENG